MYFMSSNSIARGRKRIALAGGGTARLEGLKTLVHAQKRQDIVVFEQRSNIGGIW
jgi:uncharacterized NAD(P)/FAD-binding protein YdhS